MTSSRISKNIWKAIERDFLKQVGMAILDYATFREALTEKYIEKVVPASVRSIAMTDTLAKLDKLGSSFSDSSKNEIERNLAWAIVDGFLIAACLEFGFRIQDLIDHCSKVNEWQGDRGTQEAIDREWQMYEFATSDGLQILYSKRPVVRIILEELFADKPIGGTSNEIMNFLGESKDGDELINGGMMLNGLLGASLFEFDLGFARENEIKQTWFQRANTIFELKPNIAGVGINLNALFDFSSRSQRNR